MYVDIIAILYLVPTYCQFLIAVVTRLVTQASPIPFHSANANWFMSAHVVILEAIGTAEQAWHTRLQGYFIMSLFTLHMHVTQPPLQAPPTTTQTIPTASARVQHTA